MKHDSSKQIKWGMILSYINLGMGNLIPFFYTPIMLEILGQSEYGLYKIASSTTSYLSLMAFGIGSAVSRYIIKARTQEGKEAEERMFGLFHLMYQAVALLTLVVGGVITWKLDVFYGASLSAAELGTMRILVGLMVVNTAVTFSATSYNAVVSSHERFLFIHSVNILSTIGVPLLNLAALFLGYRSIGMAVISLALNVIVRLIYMAYVRKALDIRPRFDKMPTGALKEIFAFSFWVFVGSVAGQLYDATDTVIIGMVPELAAMGAAVYSIGVTFPHIISSIGQVVPGLLMPRVTKMVFAGATDEDLSKLITRIGRLQNLVIMLIVSGFISFGKPFIYWYAGPEYVQAYWIAILIILPNCIPLLQSAALAVLRAKNLHRFRSLVYLGIAAVNIVATLCLIHPLGLIGAAIPTGGALLIGNGIIMNSYYQKRLNLDIGFFWKAQLPIFGLGGLFCTVALLIGNFVDLYNLGILLVAIVFFSLLYCFFSWRFVMNVEEKNILRDLLTRPKRKQSA